MNRSISVSQVMAQTAKDKGYEAFVDTNYELAVGLFTEAINYYPNHELYSHRSAAYTSMGKCEEALKDAEEAIKLKPDWPKGYLRKGVALHGLCRFQEALEAYEKALELEPHSETIKKAQKDALKEISKLNPSPTSVREKEELQINNSGKLDEKKELNQTIGDSKSKQVTVASEDMLMIENCMKKLQDSINKKGLKCFFDKDGDLCMVFGNEETATCFGDDHHVYFRCAKWDTNLFTVTAMVYGKKTFSEEERPKLLEYITRANYGMKLGAFQLDKRFMYRLCTFVESGTLGADTLTRHLFVALSTFSRYHSHLREVVSSTNVHEVISKLERAM